MNSPGWIGREQWTHRRLLPHVVKVMGLPGRSKWCHLRHLLLLLMFGWWLVLVGREVVLFAIALRALRCDRFPRQVCAAGDGSLPGCQSILVTTYVLCFLLVSLV